MRPEFVTPSGLYPDIAYEYAAVAPEARLVFTAGACPLDVTGAVVGPGDLDLQTHQAVANLVATLDAAGSSAALILKTTIFVVASERDELVRAWKVVAAGLQPARPPSTLLGVALLGYPGQLVEIEAIALARA